MMNTPGLAADTDGSGRLARCWSYKLTHYRALMWTCDLTPTPSTHTHTHTFAGAHTLALSEGADGAPQGASIC